ncbi:MAG: VOC family protein [Proteobacteria bacterium]|nr:VOC family protein [Pseudomonadota bacterium]
MTVLHALAAMAILASPVTEAAVGAPPAEAFFAVSVADLDGSERWYCDNLELHEIWRSDPKAPWGAARVLEGGSVMVELIHKGTAPALPMAAEAEGLGLRKAGFSVADLDRRRVLWRTNGVRIAYRFHDEATGRETAIIADPEGNLIQVFGPPGATR